MGNVSVRDAKDNNNSSESIVTSDETTSPYLHLSTSQNLTTTTHVYENIVPVTLLFVFGVVGNAIALFVLCYSAKNHKWRPFYRLVCGLAISDGGGILASYPFAEYRYVSNFEYNFPKALCDYLGFVFMFTLMSSAMIVCCMSFDRFFAIFFPFLYNTPTKERRVMVMLGCVWLLSGIISSLHLYGLGASKNYYPGSWCFLDFIDLSTNAKVIYSYIYATTGAVVVILTILINFLVIVFFIKNKFKKAVAKSNRNDLPVVLFLLMIVTVFTSCWAPLMVNIFQHATFFTSGQGKTELTFLRMGVTNSVIDPWIYILFRKEVFIMLMNIIHRLLGRQKDTKNNDSISEMKSKTTVA
ncbi:prostaglandin E2 receptor EP4 subtype-like [Saccostrea echinata]|uniref:prostaglandin E2 receptor EP4 subtype-like n=1 Tax=Saccostrea echinata TaxID=191078 RepID=UPI002A813D51|nr:prostaglandin E2 receptor EP4 subtype-like [Saccostrea echinata]